MFPTVFNAIVLLLSVAAFITLLFIALTAFRKLRVASDLIFIFFNTSLFFWIVSRLGFEILSSEKWLFFSSYLLYASAACIPLFLYFFILTFNRNSYSVNKFLFISLPTVIVVTASFVPGVVVQDIQTVNGLRVIEFGYFYPIYFLYIVAYFFIGIKLIITKYIESSGIRRKQLRLILIGVLAPSLVGVTTNLILPTFGIFVLFWLGPVFTVYMVIMIGYAIFKYNLFNVRLVVAELFIFTLWIFIFVRTLISDNFIDQAVNGSLLLMTIIVGALLVRNVKREISQREEIEKLAKKLEKTNNKLRELDKMKTEFLSLATHQIRSPLTSMRGYVSMMLEGDYGEVNESLKEPLRIVDRSSEGLIKIVNDFLDVSRMEQGRMQYSFEKHDFYQIVSNMVEEYRPSVEERGLKISFETEENDYTVEADENKMEQVIGNLIDNAVKYTQEGEINIKLYKSNEKTIRFEIIDTGVGIAPEEISKLFSKFQRAKGAEKTNVTGTGLGIYLAKMIVADHGGIVRVHSEGEGKGTAFTVELPAFKIDL